MHAVCRQDSAEVGSMSTAAHSPLRSGAYHKDEKVKIRTNGF